MLPLGWVPVSAVVLLAFAGLFYFSYTGNRATIAQASAKADAARKIAAVPIDGGRFAGLQ